MSSSPICFLCQIPADNACKDCNLPYCSEGHLKAHKGQNESHCWPFKVMQTKDKGNVLVASRRIRATEAILEEYPAAFGHHAKSKPTCMECLNLSKEMQKCTHCGFLLCSNDKCLRGNLHEAECAIFATFGCQNRDFEMNDNCLELMAELPIRVLHLRESDPEMWEKVNLLMDHYEAMKEDEKLVWATQVVEPIVKSGQQPTWTFDNIFRVIGIINTNAVSQGLIKGCALYPTFSYLSHSCVSNARFQIHTDRKIVVTALADIEAGEEITTKYLPTSAGNTRRREKIRNNWNFDCVCVRCEDATELGTYFDAIKCKNCAFQGLMLPKVALDIHSPWVCQNCDETVSAATVMAFLSKMEEEAEKLEKFHLQAELEEKLAQWGQFLHDNHYLMVIMKKRLLDVLQVKAEVSRENLERQIQLGTELLQIANLLEPGFSLKRGRLLRQLHLPTLLLAKMDLKEKKIHMEEFARRTKLVVKNMKEAVQCMENFDLDGEL